MQEYIQALTNAISYSFPEDVIEYIFNRIRSTDAGKFYDINAIWLNGVNRGLSTVKLLLKLGADINYKINGQATPIMYVAQSGMRDVVKFMIENGADLTIRDNNGNDVHYYAKGRIDIHALLKEMAEQKATEELVKRNQMLERQCQEMDGKLNYLLGMFEKMNMGEIPDFVHKKMKGDDN